MEHLPIPLQEPRGRSVIFTWLKVVRRLTDHHCTSDIGKVLAGIQVPPADADEFSEYLKKLGYPYVEETDNGVYKRFLRG